MLNIEKLENCPSCKKDLGQREYDGQYCITCNSEMGFKCLNAPDLESLKRETIEHFSPLNSTDGGLVARVIDHLAPRIVREEFVCVPEEPTEKMIIAGVKAALDCYFQKEMSGQIELAYKAMIDASKGD
jgi:hypothetical protein